MALSVRSGDRRQPAGYGPPWTSVWRTARSSASTSSATRGGSANCRLRCWRSELEVVAFFEILEQPGVCRLPAHDLARPFARGWGIDAPECCQEAEVLGGGRLRNGTYWHIQIAADHVGNRPRRHTLFGNRVQGRGGWRRLERESEEARRIQTMDGWPAVRAVAEVARNSALASDVDQPRYEAVE